MEVVFYGRMPCDQQAFDICIFVGVGVDLSKSPFLYDFYSHFTPLDLFDSHDSLFLYIQY